MSGSRSNEARIAAARIAASAIALIAAGVLPLAAAAQAGAANGPDARYRQERERCEQMQSPDERASCLREAAAARAEARGGRLGSGPDDPIRYLENALRRCEPLPPDERADCEYRVRGGGTTRGSVEAGGIYRETVTREIPAQGEVSVPAQAPAPNGEQPETSPPRRPE
ncbi:MAG: hypothetical protein LT103_00370 [Burkholderiaceae bacterium]|nr:hypothetical protein [Burkholderiaceae bacterium]ODS96685.1 MAG: hypothetical protein ABS56_12255 [Lautropia sp. SCN 69-89]